MRYYPEVCCKENSISNIIDIPDGVEKGSDIDSKSS